MPSLSGHHGASSRDDGCPGIPSAIRIRTAIASSDDRLAAAARVLGLPAVRPA
jgi:hypothetical protein